MRLHRLEFRGLGPFRDAQVIDFTDLGASGLFLLEGPTGSGKSTIIDAIVFALYGSVAGAASSRGRLVSHFLTEREEPYAELVFQTTAGTFRIRRTPTYDVAKARGTGTTTRQGKVTLTRLAAPDAVAGEVLSTRVAEAAAEINRIVGLSKEQFVATIVLPQGEFAAFLRAEGKERRPILQRIFRTEQYERLQQRLTQGRIEAERQRRAAEQALEVALGGFHGAAGSSPDDAPWAQCEVTSSDQVRAALAAALQVLEQAASAAQEVAGVAADGLAAAREVLGATEARVARRDRLRGALERSDALTLRAQDHAARVARLADADRAARAADVLAAALTAEAAVAAATQAAAGARAALGEPWRNLDLAALEAALGEGRERCATLAPVVELEQSLPIREREQADLGQAQAAATEAVSRLDAELAAVPERMAAVASARDKARSLAAQVAGLELAVHRASAQHEAARELAAAMGARDGVAGAARAALAALTAAESVAQLGRARYLDGMAAELGATLVEDEPCPVCGSREHPAPAARADEHVSREDLEAAERQVVTARTAVEAAAAQLAEHDQRLARLAAEAAGQGLAEAARALQQSAANLAAAQAAAVSAQHHTEELAALDALRERLTQERTHAVSQVAGLAEARAAAQRRLAADRATVASLVGGCATVADRLAALRDELAALGGAVEVERALAAATVAREAAVEQLAAALAREGFADPAAAAAAQVLPGERAALAEQVRRHEAELAQVQGVLAQVELQGVDPHEEIDLAAPAALLASATDEHERAVAQLGEARARLDAVRLRAAAVLDAAQARDEVHAGTAALIAVARLADGKNLLSMDLATYVLQQRFDAVVAAANEHLRVMSDGQLQLVAVEEQEGRSQKAGLGLSVVDLRTDRERSPRTLSGGETFYTALALALGLASVVTGEAGGIDLGTLFVDEGFGSLDGETLDDVLTVLTSLRAGGRTVGVVSHVEEMKVRIGERIEVRRDDAHGHSRLRVIA
ncbi:MAG TPA: SMC family ATPase [Candidatus Nanopelagicales bacterium]